MKAESWTKNIRTYHEMISKGIKIEIFGVPHIKLPKPAYKAKRNRGDLEVLSIAKTYSNSSKRVDKSIKVLYFASMTKYFPVGGKKYDIKEQDIVEQIFCLKKSIQFLRMCCREAKPIHRPAIKVLEKQIRELGGVPD